MFTTKGGMKRFITVWMAMVLVAAAILGPALAAEPTFPLAPDEDEMQRKFHEAFKPIIEAYAAFEASGFTVYDEDLIGDSFLCKAKDEGPDMAGLGIDINQAKLYFSLEDINGDYIPELFIIVSDLGTPYEEGVFGVYALVDSKPVSVLQKENAREDISLYELAVSRRWSHMGIVTELFYTLPKGGGALVLENGLYTDWNEAAQKEEYAELENEQIVPYGDHYKGLTVLITEDTAGLTPITAEEWQAIIDQYVDPLGQVIPEYFLLEVYSAPEHAC